MLSVFSALHTILFIFHRAKWVKVDSIEYRKLTGVVCEVIDDLPLVGEIITLFVVDNAKLIIEVRCYQMTYIQHLQVYMLEEF